MCGLIMPILEENNTIDQLVRMMMMEKTVKVTPKKRRKMTPKS